MLKLKNVTTHYGRIKALDGVSLEINEGEIVCLLGRNASGKSTTMKTILGIVTPTTGDVELEGRRITGWPTGQRVRAGISPVPEARRVFTRMTVVENLEMGAYTQSESPLMMMWQRGRGQAAGSVGDAWKDWQARRAELARRQDHVFTLFPRLAERRTQLAGTMSGGEQQMLAVARALMANPRLMCMDEPSMGLSPIFVEKIFDIIQQINKEGVTILVVEQNANLALEIAHRGYILQTGRIIMADTAKNLLNNPMMQEAYLAGG